MLSGMLDAEQFQYRLHHENECRTLYRHLHESDARCEIRGSVRRTGNHLVMIVQCPHRRRKRPSERLEHHDVLQYRVELSRRFVRGRQRRFFRRYPLVFLYEISRCAGLRPGAPHRNRNPHSTRHRLGGRVFRRRDLGRVADGIVRLGLERVGMERHSLTSQRIGRGYERLFRAYRNRNYFSGNSRMDSGSRT